MDHYTILTKNKLTTEPDSREMAEVMFEQFQTPGIYIGDESLFSLRWHRKSTGVIVDCGELITYIDLFYNNQRLSNGIVLNYGGLDVTMNLFLRLVEIGHIKLDSKKSAHVDKVRDLKEAYGRVSTNYERKLRPADEAELIRVYCRDIKMVCKL